MKNNNFEINDYLDIFSYKVFKCKDKNCNLNYKCFYYHNKLDKRRRLFKSIKYYPKKCDCTFNKLYNNKSCECKQNCKCLSFNCEYSHNLFELLYHPLKYKTQFCNSINICKFGKFCCNAHSYRELKLKIIHYSKFDFNFFIFKFKTEFCPIIKNHFKKTCVYAHNFQEFRRKPNSLNIIKECNNWYKNNNIPNIYSEKCSINCNKLHGWKEFDYHPKNYKLFECKEKLKNCKFKSICPKRHGENIKILKKNRNFFNIVPKNIKFKNN